MRIGLITGEYPPMQGGVADFTHALGQSLGALGHEIYVLTGYGAGASEADGITVSPVVRNWNRASLGQVQAWVRANRLDVVNLQYQTAAYNMAPLIHLLPRFSRVPFVTTFHDLRVPYLFPKAGKLRDWWVLQLARDSAAAIVTNDEDMARLKQAGDVPRIAQIPIGSNIAVQPPAGFSVDEWRRRMGIGPGETLAAYFGFLNRSKGVDVLLRALAQVHNPDTPYRLVMVGGRIGASDPTNAAYSDEIDALAAQLGLTEQVIWTGFVDSEIVSAYLLAADCCVLPFLDGASFRRGSLMAALAHGCAIVTTEPAVPVAEITSGENMLLVPPGNIDALADALRIIARDSDLRARLRAGARQLHIQFGWERIAERTVALFGELT